MRDKVDYGVGLSFRPASLVAWQAGTTTLCHSRLYSPSQRLRIWPQYCRATCLQTNVQHINQTFLKVATIFHPFLHFAEPETQLYIVVLKYLHLSIDFFQKICETTQQKSA